MEQSADTLIDARKTQFIHRLTEQGTNFLMPGRRYHHTMPKALGKFWRVITHIFTSNFIKPWLVWTIVIVEREETIQRDHPVRFCMQTFQQVTPLCFKAHLQHRPTFGPTAKQVAAGIQQRGM